MSSNPFVLPGDAMFGELLGDEAAGEGLDGLEGEVRGVHRHPVPHQPHLEKPVHFSTAPRKKQFGKKVYRE